LGLTLYGNLDGKTRLNTRTLEGLTLLDKVIDTAINKGDLLCIAGDIYEMLNPTNRVRFEFEKRLIRCNENGLPVAFVPGNHCSPRSDGSIHPFVSDRVYSLPNIFLIDKIGVQTITTKNGEIIDILGLPYLYPRDWKKHGEDSGKAVASIIRDAKVGKNASIVLGHLSVAGIKNHYSGGNLFTEEFIVPKEVFQTDTKFGAVLLGHIHQQEWIDNNIWFSGSLLCHDFGEEADKKGYVYCEIDEYNNIMKRKFVNIKEYTKFKTVRIEVLKDDRDPTSIIIKSIVNADVKNCIVRVIYSITEKQLLAIDINKIKDALSETVDFKLDYDVSSGEIDHKDSSLNNIMKPSDAVKDYCNLKGNEYTDISSKLVHLTEDMLKDISTEKEHKIKSLE